MQSDLPEKTVCGSEKVISCLALVSDSPKEKREQVDVRVVSNNSLSLRESVYTNRKKLCYVSNKVNWNGNLLPPMILPSYILVSCELATLTINLK